MLRGPKKHSANSWLFSPRSRSFLPRTKPRLDNWVLGGGSGPCLPIYLVTRMRRQVWRCHSITLPLWNAPTNTISDQTTRPLCLFVCWSLKKFPDKNAFCCQHLSKASMHTWYISWRMSLWSVRECTHIPLHHDKQWSANPARSTLFVLSSWNKSKLF